MARDDELRRSLPHADGWGAASRSLAFRRIAELLIEAEGGDDVDLRIEALATLERLRPHVSAKARAEAARLATRRWPDRAMLWLFRQEPVEVIAELAAKVHRDPASWRSVAAELPAAVHALFEAPPPPMHPSIADGAAAIGRLHDRLNPPADPPPAAAIDAELAGDWRWECDAQGSFGFVDGIDAPAASLLDLDGADGLWDAFARRRPFRDVAVDAGGQGWSIAGVPFFDRGTGRFLGYRGTAMRRGAALFGGGASAETLAKLAHEVRSPLNAIMGFAQMIESETLGAAPEPYRHRAGAILDNAQRLLGALDDLTDSARLDGGHWPIDPAAVDLGALVDRAADRFRPLAEARGVVLAAGAAPGLPAAHADLRSLDRAVKRLLAAVLAVAEPGEALLLGAQRAGADVRLFLTRPAALDELTAEALLDAVDVAAEGTTAPLLGLGFGLRLVRRLVEVMGGGFAIEPQRFTLTLPAANEQPVAKADQSA